MKHTTLSDDVLRALANADRSPGWNNRPDTVSRFLLPNRYGHEPCALYVIPARCWAYRRWELLAQTQRQHGGNAA